MDSPYEREPFESSADADKISPKDDVELFKNELEFLDTTSKLIDTLKRYKKPDRTSYTYTMIGMGRDVYAYPSAIDDYIGKKSFSSIDVTVSIEEEVSSTTLEMYGSFGRIYISRDAVGPENDKVPCKDQIIDNSGNPFEIDRVPDWQINDFLYSMSQRGLDPAVKRRTATDSVFERVVGEGMSDALEAAAFSTLANYTYELGEHTKVWFSQEGLMDDDKLASVTIFYQDYDANDRMVEINIDKGLDIKFRTPGTDNSLSDYLHTRQEDYEIALAVIRDETAKLIGAAQESRHISLESLPDETL